MNITHEISNKILEILGNDAVQANLTHDIPLYIPKNKTIKKILVLSGGGIRGIAHIGALQALQELNILANIEVFAGASVGALVIALYLIGYEPNELREFIIKFDLAKLKIMNMMGFLANFGIDPGTNIEYLIKRLIQSKNLNQDITLLELFDITKKKLIFSTVCVNTKEICYLSHENFPDLELWKAVRMSISIPFYYTPISYLGKIYIDGGCMDNYPIELFKNNLEEVIGIYLIENKDEIDKLQDIETYALRVLQCFLEGVTLKSKKGYEKYTIAINLDSISLIDYNINSEIKQKLYQQGYDATKKFI